MRCFISINLPDHAKAKIFHEFENLYGKGLFKGKITGKENLHLTLKFLGEITEEQIEKIKKELEKIEFERFDANTDSVGVFSPEFVKIIWVHLDGCDNLQKEIDKKLSDLFEKEKRFMSHITVARVEETVDKDKLMKELKKIKFRNLSFEVNKFSLMKSELTPKGPKYKILKEYKLK